ncbi:MAG: hypothetical protein EBV86_12715 [Marivivens sp.]|nr:hypothetical protein [Marivivens sp.]
MQDLIAFLRFAHKLLERLFVHTEKKCDECEDKEAENDDLKMQIKFLEIEQRMMRRLAKALKIR